LITVPQPNTNQLLKYENLSDMKILLLGATGRTGKYVIEEALKKGHKISAIARDPEKIKDYQIDITKGTPYGLIFAVKLITLNLIS